MELLNPNLDKGQIAELVNGLDVFLLPFVQRRAGIRTLPQASAVYFLIVTDEIIYIGQSARLQTRWLLHEHRAEAEQDHAKVAYLTLPDSRPLRENIESAFIRQYRPRLNKRPYASFRTGPTRPSSAATDVGLVERISRGPWVGGTRVCYVGKQKFLDFLPGGYEAYLPRLSYIEAMNGPVVRDRMERVIRAIKDEQVTEVREI